MADSSACGHRLPCSDCGSSDAVQPFLNIDRGLDVEWYTSFCFGKCYSQKGDPYVGKQAPKVIVKTEAELRAEVEDIRRCKPFEVKEPYRGIPPEYFIKWGCRLLVSEFDGKTPYAIGFPYSDFGELVGWKARPFNKKTFWAIGRTADVDPFGLVRALRVGGDTLWIVEGEFDAIALDYCLNLVNSSKRYAIISLTAGGGSIVKNLQYINNRVRHKFKHKVLVLDDDPVGKIAEEKAREIWPEIIAVAKPNKAKDANDAVLLGLGKEMGKLALKHKCEQHE